MMNSFNGDEQGPEPLLPEIDGERCVHGRVVGASCTACVSACPRDAWVMSEDSLALDVEACDACAICVAACPQDAVTLERAPVLVSVNEHDTALAACDKAVGGGKGVMPCLHAVGRDELAALHAAGVGELIVCRSDCAQCARDGGASFDAAARDLDRLLADRKLPPLVRRELLPARWTALRSEHTQPNRRSFLMSLRGAAAPARVAARGHAPAALSLKDNGKAARLAPMTPVIDAGLCEACDACVRICDPRAIRIAGDAEGHAHYAIDARRCTGCRLCIDVCSVRAVSLAAWRADPSPDVELESMRCRRCGNVQRTVADRAAAHGESSAGLCRICAGAGAHGKLFQVLP